MDGNGRWATRRGLARYEGHRRGKDSVRAVVEAARELGIPYLTLFAFSSENWQRPNAEVRFLMQLLHRYLTTEIKRMMRRDIRVIAIGETDRLPGAVQKALRDTIETTAGNRSMTIALALSYSGRQELVRASQRIADAVREGSLECKDINEQTLSGYLDTAEMPDPDLLIRTSGELRLSNFFLYQLSYTELYFTDTLWPDFREREFLSALVAFQRRERRFGTLDGAARHRLRVAN
jgi:undecaprenyl diphosphate synthase